MPPAPPVTTATFPWSSMVGDRRAVLWPDAWAGRLWPDAWAGRPDAGSHGPTAGRGGPTPGPRPAWVRTALSVFRLCDICLVSPIP